MNAAAFPFRLRAARPAFEALVAMTRVQIGGPSQPMNPSDADTILTAIREIGRSSGSLVDTIRAAHAIGAVAVDLARTIALLEAARATIRRVVDAGPGDAGDLRSALVGLEDDLAHAVRQLEAFERDPPVRPSILDRAFAAYGAALVATGKVDPISPDQVAIIPTHSGLVVRLAVGLRATLPAGELVALDAMVQAAVLDADPAVARVFGIDWVAPANEDDCAVALYRESLERFGPAYAALAR